MNGWCLLAKSIDVPVHLINSKKAVITWIVQTPLDWYHWRLHVFTCEGCHRVVIPTDHLGKVFHSFCKATRMGMLLIEAQPEIDLIVFGFNAPPKINSCWYGKSPIIYEVSYIQPVVGLGIFEPSTAYPWKPWCLEEGELSRGGARCWWFRNPKANHRLDV